VTNPVYVVKDAYIRANTAQNRFISASAEDKKIIASEVLWNLRVQDTKTQEVRYRSFYEVLAKAPKTGSLENMLGDQGWNL
jgi:hypothetical protein